MKHVRRLTTLLLAALMLLSMSAGAYAADDPITLTEMQGPLDGGSITITKAVDKERYDLYQMLYLESYDKDSDVYSYRITDTWKGFLDYEFTADDGTTKKIREVYLSVSETTDPTQIGYITWKGQAPIPDADVAAFAKLALKYAKGTGIAPVKTAVASGTEENLTVSFADLKLGYYLVDTTLGTVCSLDTTDPAVDIQEKNSVPVVLKQVKEDGDSLWRGTETETGINDADIGQPISFRGVIKEVRGGTNNIVFHDKMSNGLALLYDRSKEWNNNEATRNDFFDTDAEGKPVLKEGKEDNLSVTISSESGVAFGNLIEGTHYNVVLPGDTNQIEGLTTDDCTFHIVFTDEFYSQLQSKIYTITVQYTGMLDPKKGDALVIKGAGNENSSRVTYGDLNNSTKESKTVTKTFELPVFKFTQSGATKTGLSDTHFTLRLNTEGSQPIQFIKTFDGTGKGNEVTKTDKDGKPVMDDSGNEVKIKLDLPDEYRVATTEEIKNGTTTDTIVTNESGEFVLKGLDASSYLLEETKAHEGYNKLDKELTVLINSNGIITWNTKDVNKLEIQNNSGAELPSTGGIGTTIFYTVGGALVLAAVVLLVTKKRMSE